MARIPVYQPDLSGNERRYVCDCIDSGWVSSAGGYVARFEKAFGEFADCPYCSSVSSGTSALQTAVGALGIGEGDEVIAPTFTYIAPVNVAAACGAKVVFADCLEDSWQIDPADVASRITGRTKAIIAVHLYGGVCEMDSLVALAKEHGLLLIEDCAEAFGSRYDGRHVGTMGDVGVFSFYGNKTITTGEGGMVTTLSADLHERIRRYKNQGMPGQGQEYWHDVLGFNYRMTNLSAAVGLAQIERAGATVEKKRLIARWYMNHLADLPLTVHQQDDRVFHTYWMVSILCEDVAAVGPLREALSAAGVETRRLFPPVHSMPLYNHGGQCLPIAERISARGMNLPSWPGLQEEDIAMIAGVIRRFFGCGE